MATYILKLRYAKSATNAGRFEADVANDSTKRSMVWIKDSGDPISDSSAITGVNSGDTVQVTVYTNDTARPTAATLYFIAGHKETDTDAGELGSPFSGGKTIYTLDVTPDSTGSRTVTIDTINVSSGKFEFALAMTTTYTDSFNYAHDPEMDVGGG